jgi:glycosyltransferase involved in cell wall biosynthesis
MLEPALPGTGSHLKERLRLAYFSPLPPDHSGIVDYSLELLPELARLADLTIFTNAKQGVQVGQELGVAFQPFAEFSSGQTDFDLPLYHIGNSPHHENIYHLALRQPGLVVLHENGIHQFLARIGKLDSDCGPYVRDLGYVLGPAGMDLAWDVCFGQEPCPCFSIPLNNRLVDRSLGLIVHSQSAAASLREQRADRPIAFVPQLMPVRSGQSRRSALGANDNTIIFATIGQIAKNRQLNSSLQAFATLRRQFPDSLYLIVGQEVGDLDLDKLIADLELGDSVYRTGYVDGLADFIDWIATADVIVNLRYPTIGETSAAALRALAASRPVIVYDHGWYSELPDTVSCKVTPRDEEQLLTTMFALASDRERCRSMGHQASRFIQAEHDPAVCAASYITAIESLLAEIASKYR